VGYSKLLYWSEDVFEKLKLSPYLKPALGGLLVGGIAIFYPQVMGVGYMSIEKVLIATEVMSGTLLLLFLLKMVATSLTLGSGGSGGVFAPSLFMGAMFGGAFGAMVNNWFPHVTGLSGAYALVGMGAMVAGTTQASLTAIIILFEMTGDYMIILPLMIAAIFATLVARGLQRDSIYTMKLSRRGVSLAGGREQELLGSLLVKDVMRTKFEFMRAEWNLKKVIKFAKSARKTGFPVLNSKGRLVGLLSFEELREVLWASKRETQELDSITCAYDICRADVPVLRPEDNLQEAMKKFGLRHSEILPVVRPGRTKKVIGIVSWQDTVDAYDKALLARTAEQREAQFI
jgi:CIC family chloride channel protein